MSEADSAWHMLNGGHEGRDGPAVTSSSWRILGRMGQCGRLRGGLWAIAITLGIGLAASCGGSSGNGPGAGQASSSGGASSSGDTSSSGTSSSGTSSSGTSSGGTSSGDTSSSGTSGGPVGDGSAGTCLGADVLSAMGKSKLLVGLSTGDDAVADAAPFDIRYEYISGGLFDASSVCASCASGCTANGKTCANSGGGCAWWGCYQDDTKKPGLYVRDFIATATNPTPPQITMYTYYELLQVLQAKLGPNATVEGKLEVSQGATDTGIMTRYFADWRFLLQQIGSASAILHIEPDFWGYANQAGADPTQLKAAVASVNPTDCGSLPNTIAGMGQCMIAMVRKYAPHAFVGLQASAWMTGPDVAANTDPTLDVAAEARKAATFLAACGESSADLIVVETSDRDAGYDQSQGDKTAFWDVTNKTLPDFHQDFAWVKALTEALGKPALFWQMPLGNANQNNTNSHWKDNRVDYFFAHEDELAAAHVLGAAYGAGAGGQTIPGLAGDPAGDGGNLIAKTKAYAAAGGQAFCP